MMTPAVIQKTGNLPLLELLIQTFAVNEKVKQIKKLISDYAQMMEF